MKGTQHGKGICYLFFQTQQEAENAVREIEELKGKERFKFRNHRIYAQIVTKYFLNRKEKYYSRKRLTEDDAKNIYNLALHDREQARRLCLEDGYGERTFYKIMENKGVVKEAFRKPLRQRKWDDRLIDKCVDIVEDNPALSLLAIINKCKTEYGAPDTRYMY